MVGVAGVVSCWTSARAETWWNKTLGGAGPEVARVINAAEDPLLVVGGPWPTNLGDVLALSHRLRPEIRTRLGVKQSELEEIAEDSGEVFVFDPTRWLWEKGGELERARPREIVPRTLWRWERPSSREGAAAEGRVGGGR